MDKPAGAVSTTHKPPTSMPVPSAPRRAAPPRRKKEPSKSSDEPPAVGEVVIPGSEIPLPESTSNLLADAEGEKIGEPSDADMKPVPTTEFSPLAKDKSPEPTDGPSLVTERSTSPTLVRPGDHEDVPEDARAPSPPENQPVTSLPEGKPVEIVEEGQKEIEERSGIDQPEQELEEPLAEVSKDEEFTKLGRAVDGEGEHKALTAEPDLTEDMSEEQLEEDEDEEDEATRRSRIAARLAKSGGFNPFASDPPVRKPSAGSPLEDRTGFETPEPSKPAMHEEQELPAQPVAGGDIDPLHDEIGSPETEAREEEEPFDALKRIEGDS